MGAGLGKIMDKDLVLLTQASETFSPFKSATRLVQNWARSTTGLSVVSLFV